MYGRGNYAPQFGQGLQRPMPPYQQPPGGHPPPPPLQFQPGQRFPMQQPVIGGPPHGGPGQSHMSPGQLNMPPHGLPNSNQSFLQRPLVHGGPPGQHPYPGGQQNFSYGTQNPHHGAPPPPPPSMAPPRALAPPHLQHPAGYRPPPPPPPPQVPAFVPQLGGVSHMSLPPQALPPPPPPSSLPMVPDPPSSALPGGGLSSTLIHLPGGSQVTHGDVPGHDQNLLSLSTAEVKTGNDGEGTLFSTDLSLKQSVALELHHPPPKPADEAVVRNIDVLCQFIAKNGSQFEEMARTNESGNPKFSFLVGGEPGSEAAHAREYYLWMKKKCGLQNDLDNSQEQKNLSEGHADGNALDKLNSSSNMAAVHSPADSDVDMEDDITQTDKDPDVYTSGDLKSEPVSTGEVLEMQTQEAMLLYARDSRPALDSNPLVKSEEDVETKPEHSSGQLGRISSPIRLVQNYASDDITQNDKDPDAYVSGEYLKSEPVSTGEVSKMQKQERMLLYVRDNSSLLNTDQLVKSEEATETKPEDSSGQAGIIDSPFRLIQNYASDDNSEDEQPHEQGEAQMVSPPHKSRRCDDIMSEPAVTACVGSSILNQEALPVQSESRGTSTKGSSSIKPEADDRYDVDEPSNPNTAYEERYGTGSGAADATSFRDLDKKEKKSTSTALKVDEFGRLPQEGVSDSESDDTQRVRRRGRRGRSRTRSRSPSDRKRRRSPYKRKPRRSRSRSWSPKKRRSRSRSPYHSRNNFVGENVRRGRAETQQCFDFLKGKCYRGASCRYVHHDVGKSESSRRYRGKPYQVDVASERNSGFGNRVTSSEPVEYDDMKGEKMSYHPDKHDADYLTSKTNAENYNAESKVDVVPNFLNEEVENSVIDVKNNEGHKEMVHVQGASSKHIPHHPTDNIDSTYGIFSTSQTIHHSSPEARQDDEGDLPTMAGPGKTDPSAVETSVISPSGDSNLNLTSNEPIGPSASITNFSNKISQSPMPPLASQPISGPQQSTVSVSFPLHTVSLHVVPPYPAPLPSQQSHYPNPPISAWNVLPPSQPCPPHLVDSSNSGALHFQQGSSIPLRNDLSDQMSLRAQSGKLAGNSHAAGFQYQPYHLPSSSVPGTSFVGPSLVRDDRSSQYPSHGHGSVGTFTPGLPPQPLFPGDSNLMQSFPGSNMLPEDSSKHTPHNHAIDPSRFVDVGQSRISAHYNPYASTFDQPLSSRFSSTAFAKERVSASSIKYEDSFSLTNGPIGDPYDPLFDSIEPSAKLALNQGHEADNSEMLKVGSHQRVSDVAETKFGGVVAPTLVDNDEYGETADAEVGAVENGSLSDTDDDAIVAEGEVEIDQIQSGGSNKKSKDSRSMKLFKVAVANFVKEVLKPQWRQGNMSKEVFKTIVKKTVDKVSGAMKNHRVPKSQAKIDHYIDSSRRKLTQLVEGYVSKYKS